MDDFDLPDLSKIDDPDEYFKQLKRLDNAGHLKWHRAVIATENTEIEKMDEHKRTTLDKLSHIMAMPILRIYHVRANNTKLCSMYGSRPSLCLDFTCNMHHSCVVCNDGTHNAMVMFHNELFTQCDIVKSIWDETRIYTEYFYTLDDVRYYINK